MITVIYPNEFFAYDKAQGVYAIANAQCPSPHCGFGKVYVGQATLDKSGRGLGRRLRSHLLALRKEMMPKRVNSHLWRAWRKHGEQSFSFLLLEEVADRRDLSARETHWVEVFKSNDERYGYNKREVVDSNAGAVFKPITTADLNVRIEVFHTENNRWPTQRSGATWRAIDAALRLGTRSLPKCGGLANYLFESIGVPHKKKKLAEGRIVQWAKRFHTKHGKYPRVGSGIVEWASEDGYEPTLTWQAVHQALLLGLRGLNIQVSLPKFIAQKLKLVNRNNRPVYKPKVVERWVRDFREKNGRFPNTLDGPVELSVADGYGKCTWGSLDKAVRVAFGCSLADFIVKQFGDASLKRKGKNYSEEVIGGWVRNYLHDHGRLPSSRSGRIEYTERDGFPSITWVAIDLALLKGRKGLSGGETLSAFCRKLGLR